MLASDVQHAKKETIDPLSTKVPEEPTELCVPYQALRIRFTKWKKQQNSCLLAANLGRLSARHGQQHLHPDRVGGFGGLTCKNAILIVKYAKQQIDGRLERHEAAVEAARLRLRPILMTSFAFSMGVWPLVYALGPGSEMRQALGAAVFSGMRG
jgi:hypothetical protein